MRRSDILQPSDGFQISLIGQPNVGKSTLFTRLTGIGVISSNYPGTTVEFEEATLLRGGLKLHFHDLPGTYSLNTNSADEDVVIDMLLDHGNDAVVAVVDAMNMEPGIALCIELIELGIPIVVALNRYEVASKYKDIDVEGLSKKLGLPVIPVSARTGYGIEELLDCLTSGCATVSDFKVAYDDHILTYGKSLASSFNDGPIPPWGLGIKLLEGVNRFEELISDGDLLVVQGLRREFRNLHDDDIDVHIARDRFLAASSLVYSFVSKTSREKTLGEKISDAMITPSTGMPLLLIIILVILGTIIYVGDILSTFVEDVYVSLTGTVLQDFGKTIGGEIGEAIMIGINDSILGILTLIIPYIMVFYIILGILEDTGYLPRAVVLLDGFMHKFGLHGGGFIPLIVGMGCNVPAVLATRTLSSKRERIIACSIIVLAVPCSAQLAIIFGITGSESGLIYALAIMAVLFIIGIASSTALNKLLPIEPSSLAMELPSLSIPSPRNVLFKTWIRTKDFFEIAVPLLLVGGVAIQLLMTYDLLNPIVNPLSFITEGMLGLPAICIIAFLMGIIRKEMAYAVLLLLLGGATLSPDQYVVFGVVMAIYMPCVATLAAMGNEIGWKDTVKVSLSSILIALLVGTAFNYLLKII